MAAMIQNRHEKMCIRDRLSNGVDDQTGETIDVSGNVGQISGDILRDSDADKLTDNLWFELKTTNLNGEESTCLLYTSRCV